MSVPSRLVALRNLRAMDAPPGNVCAERPHDDATNHSEIHGDSNAAERSSPTADSDETVYRLMLVVGVIPVAGALGQGGAWGVAPTVGAFFCMFALRALTRAYIVRIRGRTERRRSHSHRI